MSMYVYIYVKLMYTLHSTWIKILGQSLDVSKCQQKSAIYILH